MSFESPFHGRRLSASERAAELEHDALAFRRRRRRRWARVLAGIGGSTAGALALIGYLLHTTDESWGLIAFWSGLLIGNAGWLLTMVFTYREAEESGDL